MVGSIHSKLAKPPIVEAVMCVKFAFPKDTKPTDEILKSVADDIADLYPNQRELRSFSLEVSLDTKNPEHQKQMATSQIDGLQIFSSDEKKVARILKNEITFSQKEPYSSGEELLKDFLYIWNAFSSKTKPTTITQISTRYINKFICSQNNVTDYLKTMPVMAPEAVNNVGINSAMARFGITSSKYDGYTGFVTVVLEPNEDNENLNVILDIDVVRKENIDYENKMSEIEKSYKILRAMKNDLFFSSINDPEGKFS
ncbi:MAG: TIGR04255 family protein [Alphaproteobacteria bacterium]|nr:TIGR04255 family protein [Alphaproteobacteria bacterium]